MILVSAVWIVWFRRGSIIWMATRRSWCSRPWSIDVIHFFYLRNGGGRIVIVIWNTRCLINNRQYPNYIISKNLCNQIFCITVSISYGRCSTWRFRFLGDGSAMIIHMEFFTFVDKVVPFNLCVSCIAIVCGSVMINMIMVVIITHHLWYNHKKTPCTTWFLVFFLIDTCLLYYILICYIFENVKWMETLCGTMN